MTLADKIEGVEVMEYEKPNLTAMHRSELEAMVVSQAKLLERFRTGIACMADNIEDEGDRAFFGSTNDADKLRKLCSDITDIGNELSYPWMHGNDLYAELKEARAENEMLKIAVQDTVTTNTENARLRDLYKHKFESIRAQAGEARKSRKSRTPSLADRERIFANEPYDPPCNVPPPGWYCTRKPGHDGPCAAYPAGETS